MRRKGQALSVGIWLWVKIRTKVSIFGNHPPWFRYTNNNRTHRIHTLSPELAFLGTSLYLERHFKIGFLLLSEQTQFLKDGPQNQGPKVMTLSWNVCMTSRNSWLSLLLLAPFHALINDTFTHDWAVFCFKSRALKSLNHRLCIVGLSPVRYNSKGNAKPAKQLRSVIGSHMKLCLGPSSNIFLKGSVSKSCLAAS